MAIKTVPMHLLRSVVLFLAILCGGAAAACGQTKPSAHKVHLPTDTVGVVDGICIRLGEYHSELKRTMKEHIAEIPHDSVSDSAFTRFVNITWERMVNDILIEREIERRHWRVTKDEAIGRILDDPPELIRKSFTDSAGTFHDDALKEFLNDPNPDTLRDNVVQYYAFRFEQEDFYRKMAPEAKTDAARRRAVNDWLRKETTKAVIDDRRTAFGFY